MEKIDPGSGCMDDLFGIDFRGALVIEKSTDGGSRRGVVIYTDLTNDSFVMIWRPEGETAVRADLCESGKDGWYPRVADSEFIMLEHIKWALDHSTRRLMRRSPSQPIRYELRLKS